MASWEQASASWESDSQDSHADRDPFDYDSLTPAECGQELLELLVDLKRTRAPMTAKAACLIAWWASRAGAVGPVGALGMKPTAQTGKFSSHFDRVTGIDMRDELFYSVSTPCYKRFAALRGNMDIVTYVPHEHLAQEVARQPPGSLDALLKAKRLPPAYHEHPVVVGNPGKQVFPLALYVDGVEHAVRGSLLAFYVRNLVMSTRHLVVAIQKRDMCTCGCRGWCTLFVIWSLLVWSFDACAKGVYPTSRHNGSPFGTGDAYRQALSGTALGAQFALLYLTGDLSEFAHTYAFPTWSSLLAPCITCHVPCGDLPGDWTHLAPGDLDHRDKDHADYEAACSMCEIWVIIATTAMHRLVRASLHYDRRTGTSSSCGRSLRCDLPELGLRRGDRLENTINMCDVADFDALTDFPRRCLFWRLKNQTITLRRNPIFCERLGITIRCIMQDELHILALGVYHFFIEFLIHLMVRLDLFHVGSPRNYTIRMALSMGVLKDELFSFYKAWQSLGHSITVVEDLVPAMFGTASEPACKLKGAETTGFVRFLPGLVRKFADRLLHYEPMVTLGVVSMAKLDSLIRQNPELLDVRAQQDHR